ncbi:MAG: M10 family metallopeptidase C-terminal domain-containing protein [Rubellimicrobium sp.]|nr:M10 family metallopeptidase C-terminal domain-containing protein [Rubellimicrobium sp.]
MTSFLISGTSQTSQSLVDGETGVIAPDSILSVPISPALHVSGSTWVNVLGTIASSQVYAIGTVGSPIRTTINVGSSGGIYSLAPTDGSTGYPALHLSAGSTEITNAGTISGTFGTIMQWDGAFRLANSGMIRATWGDVIYLGSTTSPTFIQNSGTITSLGGRAAISAYWVSQPVAIINSGEISTTAWQAIATGSGNDTLVNAGLIQGSVNTNGGADTVTVTGTITSTLYLGEGDDIVTVAGGTVAGGISGGEGHDTFDVDSLAIRIYEMTGEGTDTVVSSAERYILSANVEILTLTGAAREGFGNGAANSLTGSDLDNLLAGRGGADLIRGQGGDDDLRGGAGDDRLWGGEGDDLLRGGDGRDRLDGGAGDDVLIGGAGKDRLTGGKGADAFVFLRASDSAGKEADTITDFRHGTDHIDLSAIDANGARAGDPDFTFIGSAAFSAPGQVRAVHVGSDWVVQVNIDGTSGAEMSIRLSNLVTLDGGDFIL